MSERLLVEYRLMNPDGSEWGRLPLIEFDTAYSMAGYPFRIFEGGEWWQADGGITVDSKSLNSLHAASDLFRRPIFVMTYKQENPDEDRCEP